MQAAVSAKDPKSVSADTLVVGLTAGRDGVVELVDAGLPKKACEAVTAGLKAVGATAAAEKTHRIPAPDAVSAGSVLGIGLGDFDASALETDDGRDEAREKLRRAAGAAARALGGTTSVAFALPAPDAGAVGAIAEGALIGAYAFRQFKTGSDSSAPVSSVTVVSPAGRHKTARAAVDRALVVARAVHGARDLVNRPPSDLYPASFADSVRSAAKGRNVTVTVMDENQLAKEGFGGILGVGQGSVRPPRLVKVDYAPAKASKHIAVVGKGITFDSGGISLKPAAGMEAMKDDMGGAAAAFESVLAVADLGLPVRVTAWLAIAENMPGGAAQRPSDVLRMHGGKTVEVLNTDAEGRLVMADALVAATDENPDVVLDVATLTGAQMVALGDKVSGVMGDDALRSQVVAAAQRAGEQFWPMPLPVELREGLDSQTADIANVGTKFGGMLVAGLFLKEFIGPVGGKKVREKGTDAPRIPWAHLDIAGPAFNAGAPFGYTGKEGTGVPVRTLVSLAEDIAAG
ncbi:leucyl aminopeptidase [Spelaeicoccus albus]|uniref:Probable cytosol aminopeptidase n=1 Tax=Spelaeicoccus albus TaxID=1280376 RepID=A0A7Z0D3T2_9MICO|nr:leucyl aminopeptidase [Spelaeicoccus albus]NYI68335.1 leucyl aminopeptidase [Spelaeicoccus albus]